METKAEHFVVPVLVMLAGAALVYVGLWLGWGAVWAAAGAFFIVLGLGAEVLALAWRLPGTVGAYLRRPVVGILVVGAVVATLAVVVVLGILSRFT